MTSAPPRQRADGLDAVRAGAMLLGLAYHATYAWFPGIARWYFVADTDAVPALVMFAGLLHAFRMQVFFALSGFFSHLVFERRGARGFVIDRARRLLVPLAVAWPLVLAADVGLRRAARALGLMAPDYVRGVDLHFAPLHLWFLVYLAAFCAGAWALPSWSGPARAVSALLRWPPLLLVVLAAPTCALGWFAGELRPDLTAWPLPLESAHYGLFFALGWWLWPSRGQVERLRRFGAAFIALGLGLGWYVFRGALQWAPAGHAAAGLVAWLMTLGAFGLALGAAPAGRAWLRSLVEASYWVYLVHYPVVLALQLGFAQLEWPGVVEYLLTVAVTFAFALATFHLVVRRSPLAPWLGAARPG